MADGKMPMSTENMPEAMRRMDRPPKKKGKKKAPPKKKGK